MRSIHFGLSAIVLAGTAGLVTGSCAEKVEGCEYTGSCATPGGSSGTSGTAGTSGSSGQGGSAGAGRGGGAGNAGKGSATGGAGSAGAGAGSGGLSGTSGESGGTAAGESGLSGEAGGAGSGGDSGDAGDGGDGGSEPCNGECSGTTPICKRETETCVECTESPHCEGDTPVCQTPSNTCVECTETEDEACTGDTPHCDPTTNLCVTCLQNPDCTTPSASRCDSSHTCSPCEDSDDCAHISEKHVCDAGTCVQCTPSTESSACGQTSCDPATKTCTATARGSVGICLPCLADSECIGGNQADPDQRCVPLLFQDVPRPGGFCLTRGIRTCSRPYKTLITAESLSGAEPEIYCGIAQSVTRCEAVLDFVNSEACPDGLDSQCGCARDEDGNCIESGLGGLCRLVGLDPNRCTYQCGTNDHCPTATVCSGIGTTFCQ
jgi:hypothetical protein